MRGKEKRLISQNWIPSDNCTLFQPWGDSKSKQRAEDFYTLGLHPHVFPAHCLYLLYTLQSIRDHQFNECSVEVRRERERKGKQKRREDQTLWPVGNTMYTFLPWVPGKWLLKYYKKAIISAPWMEYSGFIAAQLCVLITESRTLEPRTKD